MRASLAAFLIVVASSSIATTVALADWRGESDRANACFSALDGDPDIRFVEAKLALSSPPTISQLSDQTIPSELEAGVIRRGVEKRRPCVDMLLAAHRRHYPYLATALELRYFQVDLVYVQLLQRRLAYGDAVRLIHESWLQYKAREAEYNQARSDAQRRAAAESLDRMSQQARSMSPPPGSGRLTCRWVGATLYCDPY